jgi:hypothetical protein
MPIAPYAPPGNPHARRLDAALHGLHRAEWRRVLWSVVRHFLGWHLGIVEVSLIL